MSAPERQAATTPRIGYGDGLADTDDEHYAAMGIFDFDAEPDTETTEQERTAS